MRALSLSFRLALLWCLALVVPGCIDPYMPDAISSTRNYLVVDGFINPAGSSTIKLSRTYDIDAKTAPPIETRATLFIEEEGGARYPVPETTVKGTYTSTNLTLSSAKNYRLSVRTSAGQEYASDFAPAKITPPIDAITWQAATNGLNIYVNSHDDTNKTQYYRWEYEETWEIVPPYNPQIEYKNGVMQEISNSYPLVCWGNFQSVDVEISNSARLSQDIISDYLLRSYPTTSERLLGTYSVLVKQYAQTAAEYQYWELLKKNTETIGTLFDPLPTQVTGNVRCLTDPSELALGYVGVHSVTTKRLFVRHSELPRTWRIRSGYENCVPPDTVFLYKPAPRPPVAQILQSAFGSGAFVPINSVMDITGVIGYTAKAKDCVDCRTRGTSVKPSFWP